MNTQIQVLLVDDDGPFRAAMAKALHRRGFDVQPIGDGSEAIAAFDAPSTPEAVRVAILDLRMPGIDGLEVLRRTPGRSLPVIVLSGHGGVPNVVEAMRLGAYTFMTKPVDAANLVPVLHQAARPGLEIEEYLGESPASRELKRVLPRIAKSREPVLLTGESGVGKALVASLIHRASGGTAERFIRVSPTHFTIPELEERLQFLRDSRSAKPGENHPAGVESTTIYIDEVTDLPLRVQERIFRWLELEPGEHQALSGQTLVEPRLVLATRRNPLQSVRRGRLDEALFYRLQVLPIGLAPLRERRDDILPIAQSWSLRVAGDDLTLTPCAREILLAHPWPGNVRELVNLVRRVSLFGSGGAVDGSLVRRMLAANPFGLARGNPPAMGSALDGGTEEISLEALERRHIESLMARHKNISRVSRILQINRRTLQRKLRSWGMDHGDFDNLDVKN